MGTSLEMQNLESCQIRIWVLSRFPGDSSLVWEVLHWEFSWDEFISTHDPEKTHSVSFLKHEGRVLSSLYQNQSRPSRLPSVCHKQWSYVLDILPTRALKPYVCTLVSPFTLLNKKSGFVFPFASDSFLYINIS